MSVSCLIKIRVFDIIIPMLKLRAGIMLLFVFTTLIAGSEEIIRHNYVYPGEALKLIPDREEARTVTNFQLQNHPGYPVELLYEFPGTGDVDWEKLYFDLRSISHLEELWYFSEHAQKYRYMFPNAYVISSPKNKRRLPDYSSDTKFGDAEFYIYLDDAELKGGKYKATYTVSTDSIHVRIQNATNLRRFIKVVNKGDFYLDFLFYEDDGKLKVYIYGAYTLQNEFIVLKLLKSPYSTLAKRVYTIFATLIGDFHGADLPLDFPGYLR